MVVASDSWHNRKSSSAGRQNFFSWTVQTPATAIKGIMSINHDFLSIMIFKVAQITDDYEGH